MPTINETIQKVHNFVNLSAGWHYGDGESVSAEMAKRAENFLTTAEGWGLVESNAFPGIDGQIELTFYVGDRTFAYLFETDGTVSITEEKRGEIISDTYDQPYAVAEQRLWELSQKTQNIELSQKTQNIYGLSTSSIGTRVTKSSGALRFSALLGRKIPNVESPSSQQNAYLTEKELFANTSLPSTVQLPVTRLSFCP